ncbi:MAG: O-antigen ligase family protein [Alphaproteobacteria bacterium]|nr:O-antigen ligase family protein [Alphaproteobacteria bacterium]
MISSGTNLSVLGLLLAGYAFFSKGFAYFGFSPFFIGEIVLVALLAGVLLTRYDLRFFRSPIVTLILLFVLWQVIAIMAGPKYSLMDTLRDSVVWGYAAFAFIAAALLYGTGNIEKSISWYGRVLPWFVVWAPLGYVLYIKTIGLTPVHAGTRVPMLLLKTGDFGVHLAGAATFLALGLHRRFPLRKGKQVVFQEMFWWSAIAAGVIAAGSRNRGGMLSVMMALLVVTVLKPNNRLKNFLIPGLIIVSLFSIFDVRIPLGGGREISMDQVTNNVASIFTESQEQSLSGTAEWRLEWWQSIIDDTVFGKDFWFGRSYGVNLAEVDGFADATQNRSPHNAHLTILARSGMPGLAIWLILIGTIYYVLLKCYLQCLRTNREYLGNINLWIMGYLTAFLVNSSFDVFLEGPQGGIWFWSLVGFAIAVTYTQQAQVVRRPRVAPVAGRRAM